MQVLLLFSFSLWHVWMEPLEIFAASLRKKKKVSHELREMIIKLVLLQIGGIYFLFFVMSKIAPTATPMASPNAMLKEVFPEENP